MLRRSRLWRQKIGGRQLDSVSCVGRTHCIRDIVHFLIRYGSLVSGIRIGGPRSSSSGGLFVAFLVGVHRYDYQAISVFKANGSWRRGQLFGVPFAWLYLCAICASERGTCFVAWFSWMAGDPLRRDSYRHCFFLRHLFSNRSAGSTMVTSASIALARHRLPVASLSQAAISVSLRSLPAHRSPLTKLGH